MGIWKRNSDILLLECVTPNTGLNHCQSEHIWFILVRMNLFNKRPSDLRVCKCDLFCFYVRTGPPSNISLSIGETSVNLTWVSKERQRNVRFHIHYLRDGTCCIDRMWWRMIEKWEWTQACLSNSKSGSSSFITCSLS